MCFESWILAVCTCEEDVEKLGTLLGSGELDVPLIWKRRLNYKYAQRLRLAVDPAIAERELGLWRQLLGAVPDEAEMATIEWPRLLPGMTLTEPFQLCFRKTEFEANKRHLKKLIVRCFDARIDPAIIEEIWRDNKRQ